MQRAHLKHFGMGGTALLCGAMHRAFFKALRLRGRCLLVCAVATKAAIADRLTSGSPSACLGGHR